MKTATESTTTHQFIEAVLRHRWVIIALWALVVATAGSGITRLSFDNDYRAYFGPNNPQRLAYEQLQATYTKTDNVMFVLSPDDGEVFSTSSLAAIEWLTDAAWQLPHSIRVDSVSNFQHATAEGDDLWVRPLVENADSLSAEEREALRTIATREAELVNRLINPDGSVTAVNVTFQLPENNDNPIATVVAAARELAGQFSDAYPAIGIRPTGTIMMSNAFVEASDADSRTLVPVMGLLIVIVGLVVLRSVVATALTFLVVGLSVAVAMGLGGWVGWRMTSAAAAAPVVIMTLGIAHCVHLFSVLRFRLADGLEMGPALRSSLATNLGPIGWTSVTTAIGFLTMNFSDSPPFKVFGNLNAIGVLVAFALTVTLVPALLSFRRNWPVSKSVDDRRRQFLRVLADFVIAYRKPILAAGITVTAILLAFTPRNELDDELVKYFDPKMEFRRNADYTAEHLTGMYLVHYSLPGGGSYGVSRPEFLRSLEAFVAWCYQQDGVVYVNSIDPTIKRLNRVMHGDSAAAYRVPERADLAAQLLLLYELSLPFGLDLGNAISNDRSSTLVTVVLNPTSSRRLLDFAENGEQWLKSNAPEMYSPSIGAGVMFAEIAQRNIRSMLTGMGLGLVLISLILIVALRDVRLGLLSLLPNLLPVGIAYGIWGLFVGQINVTASVVAGVILGIVVDDTVHLLSHYKGGIRSGLSSDDAIRHAFDTCATALIGTTLILVAGFMVLGQSTFAINAVLGSLTAIGIGAALAFDLLVLPAVIRGMAGST